MKITMEEVSFNEYETVKRSKKFPKMLLVMMLLIVLVVIAGIIGVGYFATDREKEVAVISLTPVPTQEVTPTQPQDSTETTGAPTTTKGNPTATPKSTAKTTSSDNRSNMSIVVLNGSGIAGAARGISEFLSGLGYRIVSTGNADAFTYQDVVIQIKKSKSNFLTTLKKDLEKSYTVGSVSATLAESASSDAVVTVGKD